MKPHIRTKKALWLSGFTHIAVLLCLSPLITLPSPAIQTEQIFQVTLVEIPAPPPPNIAKPGSSTIPQQNAAALQPQKYVSASSSAAKANPMPKAAIISGVDSSEGIPAAAIATGSSAIAGGDGYSAGANNTIGSDISADAAPIPGSMGYEDAIAINIVKPSYQYLKKQNDTKQTAYIRIKLAADSSIISCEVATSSGNAGFDQAAIDAAWQSAFRPAKDIATGENVPSTLLIPFSFELLTTQNEQDSLW